MKKILFYFISILIIASNISFAETDQEKLNREYWQLVEVLDGSHGDFILGQFSVMVPNEIISREELAALPEGRRLRGDQIIARSVAREDVWQAVINKLNAGADPKSAYSDYIRLNGFDPQNLIARLALQQNQSEVLTKLHKSGINIFSFNSIRSINVAAASGSDQVVKLLLELGSNPHSTNNQEHIFIIRDARERIIKRTEFRTNGQITKSVTEITYLESLQESQESIYSLERGDEAPLDVAHGWLENLNQWYQQDNVGNPYIRTYLHNDKELGYNLMVSQYRNVISLIEKALSETEAPAENNSNHSQINFLTDRYTKIITYDSSTGTRTVEFIKNE